MLEIRDLQNLISLSEHRHFGRAAAAVKLSQPALSKSIQRLEKQLGVLLFDRSRSQITPTAIGLEVIARTKIILTDVTELRRSVYLYSGLEIGTVAVGVGPAMSESYLARALAIATEKHPDTQINVRVDNWQQLSQWLLDNEIDFFVADIAEWQDDERFVCTPLPTEEFVWFCRTGHPLAAQQNVTQHDLLRFPIVTPRMPIWAVQWFAAAISDLESCHARKKMIPNIQCESYSILKRIVLSGDAVCAALTATIKEEVTNERLAILPVDAPLLTTHAGIVKLRDRSSSPLAEELIRIIQAIADEANTPLWSSGDRDESDQSSLL